MTRVTVAAVLAAVALAGCAVSPEKVDGVPAPLTATGTATPGATPSRPAAVVEPTGTAELPRSYVPYSLTGFGVTIRLPVPVGWSQDPTEDDADVGHDFGDPSGRLLLRIAIRELPGPARQVTAARAWEIAEPQNSRNLANYHRLGIVEVPGIGDSAADWTFTFDRGVRRQVIDRGISVGRASIAIYFSAEQTAYDAMLPVFETAADGLVIS